MIQTRTGCTLLVALAVTNALSILSPPNLACDGTATIYSSRLGKQNLPESQLTVTLRLPLRGCAEALTQVPNNTFIITTHSKNVLVHQIEEDARCWQGRGASGVLLVLDLEPTPGEWTHSWDSRMKFDIEIPVLQAGATQCINSVISELERDPSTAVSALLGLTPNIWQEQVFDSVSFLVLFRVAIPTINAIIVFLAIDGFFGHSIIISRGSATPAASWLGLMCCLTLSISAGLRVAYFSLGPLYCNLRLSMEAHEYFLSAMFSCGGLVSFLAAAMLQNWSGFGKSHKYSVPIQCMLVMIGINSLVFGLVLASWRVNYKQTENEALSWGLMFLGTFFTASIFLLSGRAFLRRLKPQLLGKATWRTRALNRAVRWFIAAGAAQTVIMAASLVASFSKELRHSPTGLCLIYGLVFFGLSAVGFAHALAFRPITANAFTLIRLIPWAPATGSAKAIFCEDANTPPAGEPVC